MFNRVLARLLAALLIVIAQGCETGNRTSPHARFEVDLGSDYSRIDAYSKIASISEVTDWTLVEMQSMSEGEVPDPTLGNNGVFSFYPAAYKKGDVFLMVFWTPRSNEVVYKVSFQFHRLYTLEPFAEDDLLVISDWYHEIIPRLFENEYPVSIVAHPAAFSSPEELETFYRSTGFPKPRSGPQQN